MWKIFVGRGGLPVTKWRMRIACWITKATNAHSQYVNASCSSAATKVMRTPHEVTLYFHCLTCLKEENASLIHLYLGFCVFIRLVLHFDDLKLIIAFCDVLKRSYAIYELDKTRKESIGICTETFNDFF